MLAKKYTLDFDSLTDCPEFSQKYSSPPGWQCKEKMGETQTIPGSFD